MSLRFVSLEDVRLNVEPTGCHGQHLKGTIDGIVLAAGDIIVIVDHPTRPIFRVQVALDDSAIIERVYISTVRPI